MGESERVCVRVCDREQRDKSVGHTIILMETLQFLFLWIEKENSLQK